MPDKNIIIAAGGTGGHLYPGIALASELKVRGYEPLFFVRSNDLCKGILDKEGFKYREIPAMGLPRRPSFKLLKFPFVTIGGFLAALSYIKEVRPPVVVGMGGYVSFPAVVCARLLGIPALIHEQNALPGMTNRLLSRFAGLAALSFEESQRYFKGVKTVVTGNPVRRDIFLQPLKATYESFGLTEGKFTVLVFGGSQGAARLNRAVMDSFGFLKGLEDKVQFLNITGQKDLEFIKKEYSGRKIPGSVLAYTHAIGDAYAVSDLIICRSGATTVAELKILNKSSILVPFPYATANHQEYNARALEKGGRAVVIIEKDLAPGLLAASIAGAFNASKGTHAFNMPQVFPQELLAAEVLKLAR